MQLLAEPKQVFKAVLVINAGVCVTIERDGAGQQQYIASLPRWASPDGPAMAEVYGGRGIGRQLHWPASGLLDPSVGWMVGEGRGGFFLQQCNGSVKEHWGRPCR